MPRLIRILVLALCAAVPVYADEADQYLAWGHELADSAPVINEFINERAREVIREENALDGAACDCETLTLKIMPEIYLDRFRAELIHFVETSHAVDIYPPRDPPVADSVARSIYRRVPFQFVIRVTPTLRIGDVYLGTDKLAHLFGIGRRYFVRYLDDRRSGMSAEDATRDAIHWGIFTENSVLGRRINGIFSCADLESNYRGLLLARDFCEGPNPYLVRTADRWTLAREINLRDYVTPAFDESYYPSLYADDIRPAVLTVLAEEYAERSKLPDVAARFARYRQTPPSPSMKLVERYLVTTGITPQIDGTLAALRITPDDPAAPLDALNLDGVVEAIPSE